MLLLSLATPLKANPTTTCLMWWANFRMGQPLSLKQVWRMINNRIAIAAYAEAARRLARLQHGVYWIATEKTLTRARHYNLVFLHARRQVFPAFADIALAVEEAWPWGEVASVEEIEQRLAQRWPLPLIEATIWKIVADAAARGHLLVDLQQLTLDRQLPLA